MTLLLTRDDWTMFRTLAGLCPKAGVTLDRLRRLVLKELVDNALDATENCRYGFTPDDSIFVENDGQIPGTDAELANLFSVRRPMTSSKLLRRPTRGALGNGLRVVVGAVLASEGTLVVRTGGRSLWLRPLDADGSTAVERVEEWDGTGTRIEVSLGDSVPPETDPSGWAREAVRFAGRGIYRGRPSPWWYDADAFFELLQGLGDQTVRQLLTALDGCTGAKAGRIAESFINRRASDLTRSEAERLLLATQSQAKQVKPERLGVVGKLDEYPGYAKSPGVISTRGGHGATCATVPFVVEAWALVSRQPSAAFCVNRTPITADVEVGRYHADPKKYSIFGCNLTHAFPVAKGKEVRLLLNIQCPAMPIMTDGKAPDLKQFANHILDALEKAARIARRAASGRSVVASNKKQAIMAAIPGAVEQASGGGKYRFSLRQLFYAVRPQFIELFGAEPGYNYFCQVVTQFENRQRGDIKGIYRDARGTLYHPHTREEFPLGTMAVEQYRRPEWSFNKILYCEKEGFFPILRETRWPERHDCALVTSKGFASRAARDVLDLLGETEEELLFFCIHDADGPGTMILKSLQGATKARPGRKVKVVNLGLEPAEALQMKLQTEAVHRKDGKAVPVAEYVPAEWHQWLQTHRVELNAMPTPQFVAWLDAKMDEHGQGKLVPPVPVLRERLESEAKTRVTNQTRERILREQEFPRQAADAFEKLREVLAGRVDGLQDEVAEALDETPEVAWTAPIATLADELAGPRSPPQGRPEGG